MIRSRSFNILLIFLAVLVVFFKAVSAGFLIVADKDSLTFLHSSAFTIKGFFLSGADIYYRPLAALSFFIDYSIFGINPGGFHFINILIHLSNALLVYFLALGILDIQERRDAYALIAALIFSLHPVACEPVLWISARPDLLSCFFFLLSLLLIVKSRTLRTPLISIAIFLSFLCALLSKESAIGLLAFAPLYFFFARETIPARKAIAILFALCAAVLTYLFLRNGLKPTADSGLVKIIANGKPVLAIISDAMSAYGFYLRKLLYPFPLNFAIVAINKTLNTLLCLFFLTAASIMIARRRSFRLPLLLMLTGILPPVLALIGALPFIPYAERYLYIPLAGFSLFTAIFISCYFRRAPSLLIVSIVLLTAIPTVRRVYDWTEPVTFWQDTVAKSPRCAIPRLALAAELINAGRYAEAERHIKNASETGIERESDRRFAVEISDTLNRLKEKKVETVLTLTSN